MGFESLSGNNMRTENEVTHFWQPNSEHPDGELLASLDKIVYYGELVWAARKTNTEIILDLLTRGIVPRISHNHGDSFMSKNPWAVCASMTKKLSSGLSGVPASPHLLRATSSWDLAHDHLSGLLVVLSREKVLNACPGQVKAVGRFIQEQLFYRHDPSGGSILGVPLGRCGGMADPFADEVNIESTRENPAPIVLQPSLWTGLILRNHLWIAYSELLSQLPPHVQVFVYNN